MAWGHRVEHSWATNNPTPVLPCLKTPWMESPRLQSMGSWWLDTTELNFTLSFHFLMQWRRKMGNPLSQWLLLWRIPGTWEPWWAAAVWGLSWLTEADEAAAEQLIHTLFICICLCWVFTHSCVGFSLVGWEQRLLSSCGAQTFYQCGVFLLLQIMWTQWSWLFQAQSSAQ